LPSREKYFLSAGVGHAQIAHPVDVAFEYVAALHRPHTGWRARHDEIAGPQRNQLRQVSDRLRYVPDHFRQIAFLLHHAVHLERDRTFGGMPDHGHSLERSTWRGVVKSFAHFPRAAHFFGFALHVAARHIEPDSVTEY